MCQQVKVKFFMIYIISVEPKNWTKLLNVQCDSVFCMIAETRS